MGAEVVGRWLFVCACAVIEILPFPSSGSPDAIFAIDSTPAGEEGLCINVYLDSEKA